MPDDDIRLCYTLREVAGDVGFLIGLRFLKVGVSESTGGILTLENQTRKIS